VCEGRGALRRRLVLALEDDPEVHVVAEAIDVESVPEMCAALGPDCVVVGAGDGPPGAISDLRSSCPRTTVVLLVASADAEAAIGALWAGATGFVTLEALGRAPAVVRAVSAGVAALPPLVAAAMLDVSGAEHPGLRPLTDAERALVGHLAAGRSYRAAAQAVGIDDTEAKALVADAVARLQTSAAAASDDR
jgi:DNA-binding NarL/FixJ family response regulator